MDVGLACLHKCLLTSQAVRIEWPDELMIQSFCSLINAKDSSFSNVFEFVDGLNLPLEDHWTTDIQKSYYSASALQAVFPL